MARSRLATVTALLFILAFFLSGLNATATAKGETVQVTAGFAQVLFSLSSASVLLMPVVICAMLFAVVALLRGRTNVGMMFSGIALLCYCAFLLLYARETHNSSLYNLLGNQFKAVGLSFRRRDVSPIIVKYSSFAYLSLVVAVITVVLAMPKMAERSSRQRIKRDLLPYAYIGPHLFLFIIFFVTPAIYGIYAAFTKWDLFSDPQWVGIENFRVLFTHQGNTYYTQLRNGLWNTFKFVIFSVPFCILVPLTLALALRTKSRGNKLFQSIYYLPSLLSITTVTLAWRYVFSKSYGVVNHLLMSKADWFTPPYTWIMLVIVTVWWVNGGTMVVYQSALASIPEEHYEAAAVDGANAWRKFWHITLPGMRYPLLFTFVMAVIAQFNIYGQPLILTGFSNQEANAVLLMYVYENAVKQQVAGMSAAMALVLGACIMLASLVQMRLLRTNESY